MNALQEKPAVATCEPPTAATRPFTRVLNIFCDQIKPAMKKHKVDRSVLDAIVRLLEGFHRSSIVITIPELAERAGVSNSSVSAALARLEAQGLIQREQKLLRERSRFIWEIRLKPAYRVADGFVAAAAKSSPRPPQPPAAESSQPPTTAPSGTPESAQGPMSAQVAEPPIESTPTPPLAVPETGPAQPAGPDRPVPPPARAAAPQSSPSPTHEASAPARIPEKKTARPELTAEQRIAFEALRTVNIDYWMARKLARAHAPALIHQALQNLRHRAATVRNPAAWLVREIERGGYTNPVAAQEETLKNDRLAREALQREQEARERDQAEQASEALLARYRQLEPERQRALEQQARAELARFHPRLAEAPADVTSPGPFRSKLLELLELAADVNSGGPSAQTPPPLPAERQTSLGPASAPSAVTDQVLQAERVARFEEQNQAEARERELAEDANRELLLRFAALPANRQAELERQVRSALRRVSPRLVGAPWDLETPGPIRSQLLTLLSG